MAILVDYEKVREDETSVEYRFGHPTMDQRLVIDKGTLEGNPVDGTSTPAYGAVLWKVIKTFRANGTWPPAGVYAA
jgi:hypothetical protein